MEVAFKLSRLPDFRLSHAWLRSDDGEERIRYNTAVIEVKLRTKDTVMSSTKISYRMQINRAINDMAPQVIEAVQVAFAERPDQQGDDDRPNRLKRTGEIDMYTKNGTYPLDPYDSALLGRCYACWLSYLFSSPLFSTQ